MEYVTAGLPVEDFPEEPEGTSAYFRVPRTDVPDVMGLTQKKAESAIFKAGLRAKIEKVASTEPEGEILEQSPGGGARVSQGNVVTVRISNGVAPVMIDLRGVPAGQVAAEFEAFNEMSGLELTWGLVDLPTEDAAAIGKVIKTQPGVGATVAVGQNIKVFVGIAAPPGDDGDGGTPEG